MLLTPFSTVKALSIKYFVNQKDRVALEGKNNIVYEIDCSNCESVYFGESKLSLNSRSD